MTKVIDMMPSFLSWIGWVVVLASVLFGFDVVEEIFEGCLVLGCELIQENLELLYHKQLGMDQYHAQMATAYTLFVMVVVLGYFFIMKAMVVFNSIGERWESWREQIRSVYAGYWSQCNIWWHSTDTLNRCFAVIALVVLAVPLVSIVCLALGKVVAELV